MDKICFIVAIIGVFAGMIGCGYAMSQLLRAIGLPSSVQLISCMITLIFVGYRFNRFETIIKR